VNTLVTTNFRCLKEKTRSNKGGPAKGEGGKTLQGTQGNKAARCGYGSEGGGIAVQGAETFSRTPAHKRDQEGGEKGRGGGGRGTCECGGKKRKGWLITQPRGEEK